MASSDSLHFSGRKKQDSATEALEHKDGWRERWDKRTLQWRITWEQHYNSVRKTVVKVMMGLAAIFSCLPMPDSIRGLIERKYFFSPQKVSSSHLLKSQELRQKIDGRRFHPEGVATYELDSWYIEAQGNKPTVIFSHGRDCNISHLEPIMKALSDQGYGVFVYDYPGFGRSEGLPSEEALYEAGVAACKYLAGEGSAKPLVPYSKQILMGHSLGGAVAVDIAKKFAEDTKIKDPKQRIFNREDKPALRGQPQALVLINTFTDLKEAFADKKQSFANEKGIFNWIVQRLFDENKIRLRFDSKQKIQDVSMPVLVFHGNKDAAIQPEIGAKLFTNAKHAPQGRFQLLPNAHHKLKDTMCEEITGQLTRFLDRTAAADE